MGRYRGELAGRARRESSPTCDGGVVGWRTGSQCRSRSLRHHLRCSAGGTRAPAHAALQRAMSETRAVGVASSGGGAGSSSLALAMAPAYARPACSCNIASPHADEMTTSHRAARASVPI